LADHPKQYNKSSALLRYAAAELWDIKTAPAEIDRVIREAFIQCGPVYIFLPLDLSAEKVSADLLKTPIDISPKIDEAAQAKAVKAILSAVSQAKHPAILVDALSKRFGASAEARELVKKLNVPFFSANMGKGVVDETDKLHVGVWNGAVSTPGVAEAANKSDLVITLGYLNADTNSAGFSRKLDEARTIHINPFDVVVRVPVPHGLQRERLAH
jgi:pyruvate decarboxylase